MKVIVTTLLTLSFIFEVNAQKTEQFLSYGLRPTKDAPFYLSVKEPREGKWYREVFSVRTNELVIKTWFRDEECTVKDGEDTWYNEGGKPRYIRHFRNGVKDGNWLNYHDNGKLRDSSVYSNGIRTGIALGWDKDGNLSDSFNLAGRELAGITAGIGERSISRRSRDIYNQILSGRAAGPISILTGRSALLYNMRITRSLTTSANAMMSREKTLRPGFV